MVWAVLSAAQKAATNQAQASSLPLKRADTTGRAYPSRRKACQESSGRSGRRWTSPAQPCMHSAPSCTRTARPCTRTRRSVGLHQAVVRYQGDSARLCGLPEGICLGGPCLPKKLYAFGSTWQAFSSALHAYRKTCKRTEKILAMLSPVARVQAEAIRVKIFLYAYQKSYTRTTRVCTRSTRSCMRARRISSGKTFLVRLPKKL